MYSVQYLHAMLRPMESHGALCTGEITGNMGRAGASGAAGAVQARVDERALT